MILKWISIGLAIASSVMLLLVVAVWAAPLAMPRLCIGLLSKVFYRIRVHRRKHLDEANGALLVANHVSWFDGVLMLLINRRPVRMLVYSGNFQFRWLRYLARQWGAIMISPGPKAITRALQQARKQLRAGELVGMFPEGEITRSGLMHKFRPGVMKILKGTGQPVIPIYFDGLWDSIFSYRKGRLLWKWPRKIPLPVNVYVGDPIRDATDVHPIRQAIQELGAEAMRDRMKKTAVVPIQVIKACKQRKFRSKVADSTGVEFTGGSLLMRSLILQRLLRRHVLESPEAERHVGLLMPPSVGAVVTNLAISLDRRVAVNLNYTVSSDVLNQCIAQAGIKHVLTSRKVMEKLDLSIDAEVVYLDDLREKVTTGDKVNAAFMAYALPTKMLSRRLKLQDIRSDDVLTVIFTSGSTGVPKGVMLTHENINHNIQAVDQVIRLTPNDTIVGILPFFHSFGYTVTLWAVMGLNIRGAYHFNPLDARQVGKLVKRFHGTILLSTPTFLRSFIRRCDPDEFASLDTVVAGAGKLPRELCDAFEKRFGVRPVEGYGTTELSPLVSVNVPPSRKGDTKQIDLKEGSVGKPVPGVAARTVNLESGQALGPDESGMLQIRGPNVMKGYLKQPDKTAEVIRDGWYVTGDVAKVDPDGFIWITGRESRFSKIGGEMVPHVRIEEALQEALGSDEESAPQVAVTAVPHATKGERLVVLHTPLLGASPDQLRTALKEHGFPNIYVPSLDSFVEVVQLPVLGTGKLDLKQLKQLALERFSSQTSDSD